MINLPMSAVEPKNSSPRKLLLFSQPKVGKTSLLSSLKNCLIIDLEGSAAFYGGMFVDVKNIMKENNCTMLEAFKLVMMSLEEQKKNNDNKPVYDYIAIDTTSALQEIAKELALLMYKQTPMGKAYTGTDITLLPQGAGKPLLAINPFNCWKLLKIVMLQHNLKRYV